MFETEYLKGLAPEYDIRFVPAAGSTNTDLLADESACPGTVLIAGTQSAGRGRMGRSFASPEGGLYMSVLYEPASACEALALTPRAAVAVCRAVEGLTGRETRIKWVNDVLLEGKKLCGILAEARAGDRLRLALGIGINVSAVPEGIDTAAALYDNLPALAREELAAAVLRELNGVYELYEEYTHRCRMEGKSVHVSRGSESFEATVLGIDRDFQLIVERGGERLALGSGEITLH